MIFLKIILVLTLLAVLFQDIKERKVYWFLFPLIGILTGVLYYNNTLPELFFTSFYLNLGFISVLLLVTFLYSRLKLKTDLQHVIGLGDLLLFFVLSVSFSTVAFIIIFLGALIFSLLLHIYKTRSSKSHITVPLAGYMCLFFAITYIIQWSGISVNLYAL